MIEEMKEEEMSWIQGIKQLCAAQSLFEGLVVDIQCGDFEKQEDIVKRIEMVEGALGNAKECFRG